MNLQTVILLVLCLSPGIGLAAALGLCAYSGFTGDRRAWESKTWTDVAHFQRIQAMWTRWGFIQLGTGVAFVILMAFLSEK